MLARAFGAVVARNFQKHIHAQDWLARMKIQGAVAMLSTSTKCKKKLKINCDDPRSRALALAVQQVNASYGKGSLINMGDSRPVSDVDVISTGSIGLDLALGTGGLPRGRVVEIYGPEASGKTTVALQCVAQCQKSGGSAVFVDAEHALDPAYSTKVGVDLHSLLVSQPDSGEQALGIVETLVRSSAVDLIVVDSVAALVPKAELEGEMGDSHIALQARLMSQALRKLTAALSKARCLIIFVNQVRSKVGVVFGSSEVTSGGNALRFYSSVRLEVRRGQILRQDGEAIGSTCKVKVTKNKLAPPFQTAVFDMYYGNGVDSEGELLDLGQSVGLVKRAGAWYLLVSEFSGEEKSIGQGREKARNFLKENPEIAEKLKTAIRKAKCKGPSSDDDSTADLFTTTTSAGETESAELGSTQVVGATVQSDEKNLDIAASP